MSPADIPARILAIVAQEMDVPVSEIRPATHLSGDLGADDLDRLEIDLHIETAFDLEISDEDAEAFRTVGDLIAYVAERMGVGESVG